MEPRDKNRAVVTEFFKDSMRKVRITGLTVFEDKVGYEGKGYRSRDLYDVDYSRRFGYIFHMSGSGGVHHAEVRGLYFVSGEAVVKEKEVQYVDSRDSPPWTGSRTLAIRKRNATQRLARLPKAIDVKAGEDVLDWLQNNGIEDECVWCGTCRDCFPGSNEYDHCSHIWWCDKTGAYSTPDERCACKDQDECRGDE